MTASKLNDVREKIQWCQQSTFVEAFLQYHCFVGSMVSLSLRRALVWLAIVAAASSSVTAKRVGTSPLVPFTTKSKLDASRLVQKETAPLKSLTTTAPRGGGATLSTKFCVTAGILLAFNSGYINGCCLKGTFVEATKQAVAAVTGAYTTSAIAFADGRIEFFKLQIKVLASFITGSAIASVLNPFPKTFELADNTGVTFLLASAFLFAANFLAGGKAPSSNWIFYFAAIANGIQNSVTSVHTANLCRTSHYSGISSDIGTFSGQCIGGNDANLFKLKVFLGLAAAFWLGGYVSYFVTEIYGASSLIFPAIFDFLIGAGLTLGTFP